VDPEMLQAQEQYEDVVESLLNTIHNVSLASLKTPQSCDLLC